MLKILCTTLKSWPWTRIAGLEAGLLLGICSRTILNLESISIRGLTLKTKLFRYQVRSISWRTILSQLTYTMMLWLKRLCERFAERRHRAAMACFAAAELASISYTNHADREQAEDRLRKALSAAGPAIYKYSHPKRLTSTFLMDFANSMEVLGVLLHKSTKIRLRACDINHKNDDGSSALFFSISNPKCVQMLLLAGADPLVINCDGETVLQRCVKDSLVESAHVLLQHCGGNEDLHDPAGRLDFCMF